MIASYHDETGRLLLREQWTRTEDGAQGAILEVASDQLSLKQPIDTLVD